MDDYIKRQDAIDELMRMVNDHSGDQFGGAIWHYTGIKAMLECMEPANVRPVVHGKWIPVNFGDMRCSICGGVYGVCGGLLGDYYFCPNCGADMRGGDAE